MDTSAINAASLATATASSGKESMSLQSDDFLKIMLAELTNQDPFEPVSNEQMVNQMATIQQIQSSQEMSSSFAKLMEQYESVLLSQTLSTASAMIGQTISGITTTGSQAIGKVVAVNTSGSNVYLELDTGQQVHVDNMLRLGGSSSQDIIGKMAVGTTAGGEKVVGEVVSVQIDQNEVILRLHQADKPADETVQVPLRSASVLSEDTADLLIGYTAQGQGDIKGVIESVEWTAEGVLLNLMTESNETITLPLEQLTKLS